MADTENGIEDTEADNNISDFTETNKKRDFTETNKKRKSETLDEKDAKWIKQKRKAVKEFKKKKQEKLVDMLDRKAALAEAAAKAAKPVPKNILSGLCADVKGRNYTVSIALPGSILDNQQNPELRSYVAGQIARAASVFNVDEIVVFDDTEKKNDEQTENDDEDDYVSKRSRGVEQLTKILQYLECPQYLRKFFFPIHPDLKFAGVLNPTDMPHHLRADDISIYREGIVSKTKADKEGHCLVKIGLNADCCVNMDLMPSIRVTVKLNEGYEYDHVPTGTIVSPSEPRNKAGVYWGYTVRVAENLSSVFTGSTYKGGYDLTIGTSEKGKNVDDITVPKFEHLLIVFGGVGGLEQALQFDDKLEADDPKELFDHYVDTCPNQGSRTIRSEEALFVSLSALRPIIKNCQKES